MLENESLYRFLTLKREYDHITRCGYMDVYYRDRLNFIRYDMAQYAQNILKDHKYPEVGYWLCKSYYEGVPDTGLDDVEAKALLEEFAEQGHEDSTFLLERNQSYPNKKKRDKQCGDASGYFPDVFRSKRDDCKVKWDKKPVDGSDENFKKECGSALNFASPKKVKARKQEEFKKSLPCTLRTLDQVMAPYDNLIGLNTVKDKIRELSYMALANNIRLLKGCEKGVGPNLHMVFTGNPGTGKTTVARMVGQTLKTLGYLERGQVVEVDRSQMVGAYIGHTEAKIQELIKKAQGGVLFVDEAHELETGILYDFGQVAMDTIAKAMEDRRSQFVVIMAGYAEQMDWLIKSHPGLQSRIGLLIDFMDYTDEEKVCIFKKFSKDAGFRMQKDVADALMKLFRDMPPKEKQKFGNGRGVRNLFEETLRHQARRIVTDRVRAKSKLLTITAQDIPGDHKPQNGKIKLVS